MNDLRIYNVDCPHCEKSMTIWQQGERYAYISVDSWHYTGTVDGDYAECPECGRQYFIAIDGVDVCALTIEEYVEEKPPTRMAVYQKVPEGYERVNTPISNGQDYIFCFQRQADGLRVIATHPIDMEDGKDWLHVSCAFPDKDPSYADLAEVKHLFIGDDKVAFMKFVVLEEHVNIHDHALHLWAVWDGDDPTPDFTQGSGMI